MAVRCEGLSIGYDSAHVVENVSFNLQLGRSMLVVGYNGAGKSTLLRTLFCLLPRLAGEGEVLGAPLDGATPRSLLMAGARFMGQGLRSFDFLAVWRSRQVLNSLFGFQAGVFHFMNEKYDQSLKVGSLSVGQRRLEALRLLSGGDPKLYILDEPSAGIDPEHLKVMIEWIKRERSKGVSFIIAEHNFKEFMGVCDSGMILRKGMVEFEGPVSGLMNM